MKRIFNPRLTKDAGSGLELQVVAATTDRSGNTIATIEVWNGKLLHSDSFNPGKDLPRRRCVKQVETKCAPAVIDAPTLDLALVELAPQIARAMQESDGGRRTDTAAPLDPEKMREQAAEVLAADDPLKAVAYAIRALGYGGDLKPALITYLAVTSRLLGMRPGAMPVHLLLLGPPSAGKSYTLGTVLRLHPDAAYHTIDAGSPRVLLYDTAPLKHRALVFAEADSLPAGEDNPAASAVRGLLQEHHLVYKVTVMNPESGQYEVQEVTKDGPTVLITTAVRQLGEQLSSRLFALDVPYDLVQLQAALNTQARLELSGAPEPDAAIVAFHAYLQDLAPWDVSVPFADTLATLIGRSASAPRINRDFSRLLALIKSVAILRHQYREKTAVGRLVAEVADYETVYRLVAEMYESAVTGVTHGVRAAVTAVSDLKTMGEARVTVTRVGERLGVSKMAASRAIKGAIKFGWLVNAEQRKGGYPHDLVLGEPMPERAGLPDPGSLRGTVEQGVTTPQEGCNAVTDSTARESVRISASPTTQFGGTGDHAANVHTASPTVEMVTPLQPSRKGVTAHVDGSDTAGTTCLSCSGPLSAAEVAAGFGLHYDCTLPVGAA